MDTYRLPNLRSLAPRLRAALREDAADRDVTTRAVIPASRTARGVLVAKSPGILAGAVLLPPLFRIMDPRCRVRLLRPEGSRLGRGSLVARVEGRARALLSVERTALNLLSRLSGIATLTRRFAEIAGGRRVFDTRKTTPLWRDLERYAVRVGGGRNHRPDLSAQVLIKDNHLALGGGITRCVTAARKSCRGPVEVEVETILQAREALASGADILLVDNASPRLLGQVVQLARGRVVVEASGGMRLSRLPSYARVAADRFSAGALTHSVMPVDFSLDLFPS